MEPGLIRYFVIPFFLLLSFSGNTQIIVKGIIKDIKGKPVQNATVIFKYMEQGNAVGAISKSNGFYSIHIKQNVPTQLCISYVNDIDTCIVLACILKDTTIDIILTNKNVLLKNVVIKSEEPIKMDTTGFKVDSIKKLYHRNIEALLNEIPGLQFINGSLHYKGKIVGKLLFEGDNITGSDYKRILKNLSTNGMDSIQIINNYVDKSELGNFYKKYGDEVVINFTFKGKKKLRNYGRAYAGIGSPDARYEAKVDDITLLNKFKSITLANKNNNGNTNQYLFNTSGAIIPIGFKTIDALHPLSSVNQLSNEIAIADISPYFLGSDRIYTNQTFFLTNDFYRRLSKKVFIGGNIGFNNEQLKQNINQTNIYFDSSFTNTNSRDNSIKNNTPINIKTNLSWLISPRVQYSSTFFLTNNPGNTRLNGIINNDSSNSVYQSSEHSWLHTHNLTKLYNKNNLLKMQIIYGKNSLNESNNTMSDIYKSLFQNDSISGANQLINKSDRFTGAVINYNFVAKPKLKLDFFTGMLHQQYQLQTRLTAYDNQNNNIFTGENLSNHYKYNQGSWYASLKGIKAFKIFNKTISVTIDPILQYNTLSISSISKVETKKYNQKLIILPNAGMSLKLIKNISFQCIYAVKNTLTMPLSFYEGAVLKNQSTLYRGYDTAISYNNSNTSFAISLDGKKGKVLRISFNTGFTPMMPTVNVQPNGIFIYLIPAYANKPNHYNSFSLYGSFLLKKVAFSINANTSLFNYNYKTNNYSYKSRSVSPYIILNVSTYNTKNISQKLNIDWQASFQKNSTEFGSINRYSNQFIKATHEVNFTFLKAYTFSLLQKYIAVVATQSNSNKYYFIDIFASRTLKNDRFTFFINGKNLGNQTKFAQVSTTGYYQTKIYSTILPRMILAGIEIKF